MLNGDLRWYILFANYEQGLALRDLLLKHGHKNRIAPAPRAIQGELSCGMSLLIGAPHPAGRMGSCYAPYPNVGRVCSHPTL